MPSGKIWENLMKKVICIALAVFMLLPMLTALPVSAATPRDGFTFSDSEWYYADSKLEKAPRTIEAWVYVDPAHATERSTIISNYNGFTNYGYWHFDLKYANGVLYPYFEWNELYNNGTSNRKFNFTEAVITAGEWVHIAIVINAANNYVSCYKNGQHIQNNDTTITLCDISDNVTEFTLGIGNDCRPAAEDTVDFRAFNGKISSISLFDDVRSASEIASDYANGADITDKNALAHWEFTSSPAPVEDKVGNVNLSHNKFWLSESEMNAIRGNDFDPAYSFAVVGDIQYITEYDMNNATDYVKQIHKWIGDNAASDKKNIKFVMGVGDITNGDKDAEWQVAYNGISSTLNGKVNYSLVRGNHDLYGGGSGFDKYFGNDATYTAQYTGHNGGTFKSGSYVNSYTKFTVGSTKWLIINFDFAVNDEVLAWANDVVSSHPDHKVIMTTHGYAHMDGTPISDEDSSSLIGKDKNNGEEMWTKFASLHENMVMVISGHMECNFITINQAKGVHGNTVSQFLIDQQTLDKAYMSKEGKPFGLVAMFYFDKDGKNVSVEWYSTLRDKYFQTCNQFSFDMAAKAEEQTFGWCGLSYTPKGSGTQSDPYIIENGGNLVWISENCKDATKTSPAFEGKYFKQVCDIDLNNNLVKSIGYYHTTANGSEKMAAFGGTYDGGGYSIKNGRITAQNINHAHEIAYSDGLFGAIYGATIKNVTLDNIDVYGKGVTGVLVGRAVAPFDGYAEEGFNIISGCTVKSNCNVYAYLCLDGAVKAGTTYGSYDHAGIVGSICGMAYSTIIEGCVSQMSITVDGNHSVVGGIVGAAGYNTSLYACAFKGGITLTGTSDKTDASVGGIVGAAIPNALSTTAWSGDNTIGYLDIACCYNSGSFSFTGGNAQKQVHWGGIIGNASDLYDIEDCVNIYSCYNLYERKTENALSGSSNYWAGGIVGKASATAGASRGTVTVRNSASIALSAAGGSGSNECRYENVTTSAGLLPLDTDASVKTLGADALADSVAKIDEAIAAFQPEDTDDDQNENNGDNNTDPDTDPNPENTQNPTEKPTSTSGTQATTKATEPEEEDGCGSSIAVASILVCALAGGAFMLKKKED